MDIPRGGVLQEKQNRNYRQIRLKHYAELS